MSTQLESLRRYVADRPPLPPPSGGERVLLVGSGKGGVGTSTVAALIAVLAAADGLDVLVVDADEGHGVLPLLFGVEPRHPLAALRGGAVMPPDLLVNLGHGLMLLPAGGDDAPDSRVEPVERRSLLRRVATLYEDFDLVVVDAGSRLEQVLAAASAGGSRLLAVTAPERVSAAATYALVKVVDAAHPGMPIELVFNRCRLSTATAAFDDVDAATRQFLRRAIDFAGGIPDDERLRAAIESGTPIQDAAALGSPATAACHDLAANVCRQVLQRESARPGRAHDVSLAVAEPRLFHRR